MNLLLAELEARYLLATFDEQAEAHHRTALGRPASVRGVAFREHLNRTAGRLRLVRRGSAV